MELVLPPPPALKRLNKINAAICLVTAPIIQIACEQPCERNNHDHFAVWLEVMSAKFNFCTHLSQKLTSVEASSAALSGVDHTLI